MADTGAQSSDYPNLNPTGTAPTTSNGTSAQNLRDNMVNNAQSAANAIANHPVTQSVTQGPVAEKAKEQANLTSNEFSNVLDSRRTPDQKAATGQPLTYYHSMFFNILSWENPRVTGISYAAIVIAIFFTRYVPVLKYALKGTYIILGIIAAAELAGKVVFDKGLATQVRPRKYYTIPRESLERSLEDVEQLINFFVIEFQRILFAENVYATIAAFSAALISYFLVKFVPTWGITLIATTVVYFVPLIYITNQDLIDEHLNNAGNIINEQATQVRDLAAQHTSRAAEATKSTVSQYSAKAQDMIGQAKSSATTTAASPDAPNPANLNPYKNEPEREVQKEDFPTAPSAAPANSTSNTNFSESQALPAQ